LLGYPDGAIGGNVNGRKQLGILSAATLVVATFAALSPGSPAAAGRPTTLVVGQNCPGGHFRTIQSAIDAARSGDTVRVCAGTYVEGSGAPGSNALTITKNIDLAGAGADQVRVQARKGAQLVESHPDIHHGKGDLVAVVGSSVDISGITFDVGNPSATVSSLK